MRQAPPERRVACLIFVVSWTLGTLSLCDPENGNDFVICNDYGFPINPDSYVALVRRVGKKRASKKFTRICSGTLL